VRATAVSGILLLFWGLVGLAGMVATVVLLGSGDLRAAAACLAPIAVFVPVLLVMVVPLKLTGHVLVTATTEYRVYDDTLIACDTRLAVAQWRFPLSEIVVLSIDDDSVTVETSAGERVLRHVADPDRLIETVERSRR
jgi:hypothetical protein